MKLFHSSMYPHVFYYTGDYELKANYAVRKSTDFYNLLAVRFKIYVHGEVSTRSFNLFFFFFLKRLFRMLSEESLIIKDI